MCYNLVSETKNKVTESKIGTWIAFTRDTSSKLPVWLSILPATQEQSPWVRPNPISTWYFARNDIFEGKSLRVQPALLSQSVTNRAQRRARETLCGWVTMFSPNQTSFDYFLVEKSVAAYVILRGWNAESAYALQCCRWWCGCNGVNLGHHNCQNHQIGHPILGISLTEVVCCVPASRLCQFIKHQLILLNTLHVVLYHFVDCAHHPAEFVILAQHTQLCIFFIIILLLFLIVIIVGTWKIAPTVSDWIHHLLKGFFRCSGCWSCLFSISHILLLLHNRCLCGLNSLWCHSGLYIHIIVDPFLLLFIA